MFVPLKFPPEILFSRLGQNQKVSKLDAAS